MTPFVFVFICEFTMLFTSAWWILDLVGGRVKC
jgi:hypothetical protein